MITILAIAIILLILPTKISRGIRNFSWQILKPISFVFSDTIGKATPYFKKVLNFQNVISQNSDLISENLQLQSQVTKLSEVQNENEILKKELGFMQTQDLTTTTAAAVIGTSGSYLKSLVIDKGQDAGLVVGEAVISQGILIGQLSEVRQNNSDVLLITDSSSQIPVVLQNSRGTGLLSGGLGGLVVEDIPLNIAIVKNENVVTSGLGNLMPAGILVGRSTDIVSHQGEIFQKAAVASPVDFSNLKVVFVLKK